MRPLREALVFSGRIRFDGLTDVELGALLCALDLPADCAHKLGRGRPIGLGSVRVTVQSCRTIQLPEGLPRDIPLRYQSFFATDDRSPLDDGMTDQDMPLLKQAFHHRLNCHRNVGNRTAEPEEAFWADSRMQDLLHLLSWDPQPVTASTTAPGVPHPQWQRRFILPTPTEVAPTRRRR